MLVSGEPVLDKDNIVRLIHFGSADRSLLLMAFDASNLNGRGVELFGREGAVEPSLISSLSNGNLLIKGIDLAEAKLRERLIALTQEGHPDFSGRVFFTAEARVKELDGVAIKIKVPPVRVRRSDLGDLLRYNLRLRSHRHGWSRPPELPQSVVKRLQSHDFPNNFRELENVVERALRQTYRQMQQEQGNDKGTVQDSLILPAVLPQDVF